MIFRATFDFIIFNDRFNHAERSYDSIESKVRVGGIVVIPKIVCRSLSALAVSGYPSKQVELLF